MAEKRTNKSTLVRAMNRSVADKVASANDLLVQAAGSHSLTPLADIASELKLLRLAITDYLTYTKASGDDLKAKLEAFMAQLKEDFDAATR